jgi:type II secretory pathway pseudopilin PulG
MPPPPAKHPSAAVLRDFGLKKLDAFTAAAVAQHLQDCPGCQDAVARAGSEVPTLDEPLEVLPVRSAAPERAANQRALPRQRGVSSCLLWGVIGAAVAFAMLVTLAAVGVFLYLRHTDESQFQQAEKDVRALSEAAETYRIQYGDYPPSLQDLAEPGPDGNPALVDPSVLTDPWGRDYFHQAIGSHNSAVGKPDIWSTGPRPGDPSSVIGNWPAGR